MTVYADEAQALLHQVEGLGVKVVDVEILPPVRDRVAEKIAKFINDTLDSFDQSEHVPGLLGDTAEAILSVLDDHDPDIKPDEFGILRGQLAEILVEFRREIYAGAADRLRHRMRVYAGVHLIPHLRMKDEGER